MVYVDKPKPSNFYVLFPLLVVLAETVILAIMVAIISWGGYPKSPIINLLVGYLFFTIPFYVVAIFAPYNTEYRIENGGLWIKCGIRKGSVSLDEIKGVEKVESFRAARRQGFKIRNYCNRYKNGVLIITEKRIVCVSPEDSERFISELGLKTGR